MPLSGATNGILLVAAYAFARKTGRERLPTNVTSPALNRRANMTMFGDSPTILVADRGGVL